MTRLKLLRLLSALGVGVALTLVGPGAAIADDSQDPITASQEASGTEGDNGDTGETEGDNGETGETEGDNGDTGETEGDNGDTGETEGDNGDTGETEGDNGDTGETEGDNGDTGDPNGEQPELEEFELEFQYEVCLKEGWLFELTEVTDESAPEMILAVFGDLETGTKTQEIELELAHFDEQEGIALYAVEVSDVDSGMWELLTAFAMLPPDWEGDFSFAGPELCEAPEPKPTKPGAQQPPIKKIVTGVNG